MPAIEIDADAVLRLAAIHRLPLSLEDAKALAPRLSHLLSGVATLDALPLDGVVPAPVLDPRWEPSA